MKKKILFIVPSLTVGGSQRVMLTLLKNINRNLFDISLIIVTKKGEFYDQVPNDINIVHLECKRMLTAFAPLYKIINKLQPDIIFSTLGYLNFILILLKCFMVNNFKLVVRESNTVSVQIKSLSHTWLWWLLYRFLYKKADKIICQSDYMLDDLMHKFLISKEKMTRIYNPIDTLKIRKKAGFDPSPFLDFGKFRQKFNHESYFQLIQVILLILKLKYLMKVKFKQVLLKILMTLSKIKTLR